MEKKQIQINLNRKHKAPLTENTYTDFSNDVYYLMRALGSGDSGLQLSLTGTQPQIMAFFAALQREKKYMDSYVRHGLNNAHTMSSRYDLESAVRKFEFETGLKWPFKN